MFLIGTDENDDIFIAPHTWKISDYQTYWPPSNVKDKTSLIKRQMEPNPNWPICSIRWFELSAGNF